MEYKNDKLSARFVVPDRITVKQQLKYFSEASMSRREDFMERLWDGACTIMTEWECVTLPDKDTPLDSIDDPKVTDVIIWAALAVQKHINGLDEIPKNS